VTTLRKGLVTTLVYVTVCVLSAMALRGLHLPDEEAGLNASFGPFNAFLQQVAGKMVTTDFQVDLGSAVAMLHREDPYGVSADIFARFGLPSWGVAWANPHPPTTVAVVAPFALLSYQNALTAWSILMVFALVWTIQLMGVRLAYAIPAGLAIAITFPGAYAIGNVVPLIGLGIALAYCYRDNPLLAAFGIVLATAPKTSGLLLLIPFLLTRRWRTVGWAVGFLALLAALPLAFYPDTWGRYLDVGIQSVAANAARDDNASLLNLADKIGIGSVACAFGLSVLAAIIGWQIKDTYWPVVWLLVAILPIAWTYSLVTLIPLFCMSFRRRSPWSIGAAAVAAALMLGSPPLGMWPTRVLPIVVLLAALALLQIKDQSFWFRNDDDRLPGFVRKWGTAPSQSTNGLAEPPPEGVLPVRRRPGSEPDQEFRYT